jgi:hypothetical protein
MWLKYEACFDSIVPKSRRNNRFAAGIRSKFATLEAGFAKLATATSIQGLTRIMNSDGYSGSSRYHKLNLESMVRHGTVEFRQHSGTVSGLKMVNWVMPAYYAMFIVLLCYLIPNNKYLEFRPDYNNTYMHKSFTDHMIATFRGKDMSSMERLYRWIAAVRMSKDRPITGYGPHGFYYNYKPYAVSSFKTYVSRNPEHSTTHNYFLYMLVEQGWPAMLLYAALIPMLFAKAQKIYYRFKDIFYRSVTLGLAMMLGAGFINNFFSELIETHKVGAFFYIPVALLIVLDHMSKSQKLEEDVIN